MKQKGGNMQDLIENFHERFYGKKLKQPDIVTCLHGCRILASDLEKDSNGKSHCYIAEYDCMQSHYCEWCG